MDPLTYSEELFIAIRRGDELVAVEQVNGSVYRWVTEKANNSNTMDLYGIKSARN